MFDEKIGKMNSAIQELTQKYNNDMTIYNNRERLLMTSVILILFRLQHLKASLMISIIEEKQHLNLLDPMWQTPTRNMVKFTEMINKYL